jgi:hypothetical protein
MKSALFYDNVTRRCANDDTWKRMDKVENLKILEVRSGECQGKRKAREFKGGGEEIEKKGRIRGGWFYKPSGVVLKDVKIGSGVGETNNQPR